MAPKIRAENIDEDILEALESEYFERFSDWVESHEKEIFEEYASSDLAKADFYDNHPDGDSEHFAEWLMEKDFEDLDEDFIRDLYERDYYSFDQYVKNRISDSDPEAFLKLRQIALLSIFAELWVKKSLDDNGIITQKIIYPFAKRIKEASIRHMLNGCIDDDAFIKLLYDNIVGLPDYICRNLKNNDLFFLEVKSNLGKLTKAQEETFKILDEHGYKVVIRRVKITDFKLYDIDETGNEKLIQFPNYSLKKKDRAPELVQ